MSGNYRVEIEATDWTNFLSRAIAIMRSPGSLFKKALLVVWPREIASHFEQEMGPEGAWAAWKTSTRSGRLMHEIRTSLGKQHAGGRLTNAAKEAANRKLDRKQGRDYAKGKVWSRGGKLLQKTGKMRNQTVNEPIVTMVGGRLKVESPTPYSGYHDEGTKFMEARPFMWLGDDAMDNLSKVFAAGLAGED